MKTNIKVFVTKNRKFRARIKPYNAPAFEVTVGGKKWDEGHYGQYQAAIHAKIWQIVGSLEHTAKRLTRT